MQRAVLQGATNISITSSEPGEKPRVIYAGGNVLSLIELDDGIVFEFIDSVESGPSLRKCSWEGPVTWTIREQRPGQIKSTNGHDVDVDGASIAIQGTILNGYALHEGFLVIAIAGIGTGDNVCFYAYGGALRWRIEVKSKFPQIPFWTLDRILENGNPLLSKGGTASEVDIATGRIIREVDWKA